MNEACCRVPCVSTSRTCYMFVGKVCIGSITEESNDSGETDWVFKFYWDEYEAVGSPDIIGLNTDLRLPEYVRKDTPTFVEARTKSDKYENLQEELARVSLWSNDRFEYMLRTQGVCSKDKIKIGRTSIWETAFDTEEKRIPHPRSKEWRDKLEDEREWCGDESTHMFDVDSLAE